MNARQILYGSLLLCVNAIASACDLPALVILPAPGTAGDASAELIVDMQRYVGGIRAYTACVQAEIAAAGGDSAPESLRTLLVRRNNGAVAEAKALMELFGERVAPVRGALSRGVRRHGRAGVHLERSAGVDGRRRQSCGALHRACWAHVSQRARKDLQRPRAFWLIPGEPRRRGSNDSSNGRCSDESPVHARLHRSLPV